MTLHTSDRRALALDALTGLSVGDAAGNQGFPPAWRVRSPERPAGAWSWTDDTQMACSLVEVLFRYGQVDQSALAQAFAEHAQEVRDYGSGALSFMARVRAGEDWQRVSADLFDGLGSWGNGGAMRVAPLGAWFADDLDRAAAESARSAEVTHAHPEGVAGAVAVGVAAAHAAALRGTTVVGPAVELFDVALRLVGARGATALGLRLERATTMVESSVAEAAQELGNGARISAVDTVPFALWVAVTHFHDFAAAIEACQSVGGDMDTTAAMVGGILAAHHGPSIIPRAWREIREPLPAWLAVPDSV
ncbi:ADP-ribosylglycohydrolase family protein [Actinoalloteichus hymeniacidonis]|uniref:ADP-ribosylglycohydrolase n=1 Tax=Actinoalloteichus hymeniacidonis TaxID=340345 RepID=A0AAC9HRT1_9PSEU|nr:ADP-ribosylglycohydrolase family protein [Actinoalloteichus hymeniacidonis]AOS63320.1 ADP-ribosylglycohydrolase [Actinoalloteichus hymeniacidonis]MBB5908641.1 ADP-ribosylglycohydrolase [Actinoalloteichus hymeniacidonis]